MNRPLATAKFKKSLSSILLAGVLGSVIVGAAPAGAATIDPHSNIHTGACNTSAVMREVTSKSSAWVGSTGVFHSINGTNVANTVTFKAGQNGTMSASVTGTIEGGINAGIATAKASVASTISASVSYSTSYSVKYSVAPHTTGYAQVGSNMYTMGIRSFAFSSNCASTRTIATGTLRAPTSIGWKTWN